MPLPTAKPFNVPQALAQALDLHHQGRLAEAGRLYAGILAVRPENFDALHMSGLIRLATGDLPEALRLVAGALQARPSSRRRCCSIMVWCSMRSIATRKRWRASTRAPQIQKAKYAEAFQQSRRCTRRARARRRGRYESYNQRHRKLKPDYAEALFNLG